MNNGLQLEDPPTSHRRDRTAEPPPSLSKQPLQQPKPRAASANLVSSPCLWSPVVRGRVGLDIGEVCGTMLFEGFYYFRYGNPVSESVC